MISEEAECSICCVHSSMEKKVTNFKRVNESMVFAGNRVRTYKGPKCPQKACNQLTEHIYDLAIQGINMSRPGLNMSVLIDTSKSSLIRIRIVYASKAYLNFVSNYKYQKAQNKLWVELYCSLSLYTFDNKCFHFISNSSYFP